RLHITKENAEGPVGVYIEGYWGMALRPDSTYKGSFYAQADSSNLGAVTLSLVNDNSGAALATTTAPTLTTEWKQYPFTLKTGKINPSANNHLVLTVAHPGKLWLGLVSLFPPTFHDRENGNRPDLMEMMSAMHPKFLRLPGGNYLEG